MQILGNQGIQHNLFTLSGVLFNSVLLLIFLPFVFGLELMGRFFFIYEFSLFFFPVISLGIANLPAFYLPKTLPSKRNDQGLGVVFFWLMFLIVVCLGYYIFPFFAHDVEYSVFGFRFSESLILIFLTLILAVNQFVSLYAHFIALRLSTALSVQTTKFIVPFLAILFYTEYISFESFILLFCFSGIIPVLLLAVLIFKRGIVRFRINPVFFKSIYITWFSRKARISWWKSVAFVLYSKGELIVLALLLTSTDLAVYVVLLSIIYWMHIPRSILGAITGSIITRVVKNRDIEHLKSIYRKSSTHLILTSVVFIVFFYFVGWELMGLLPSGYILQKFYSVLIVLGVAKLIGHCFGLVDVIIAKSQYERVIIPFQFFSGIMNVLFALVLIPKAGIIGAAYSSLLTTIIFSLFCYIFVFFRFRIQPFSREFVQVLLIATVIFVIFAVGKFQISGGKWGLVFFVLYCVIYSYTVYKTGLSADFTYWVKRSKDKIFKIIKSGF